MQKDPREAGHPHTHDETVEEDDVQSEVAGEEQDLEEAEGGEEKDEEYSEPND